VRARAQTKEAWSESIEMRNAGLFDWGGRELKGLRSNRLNGDTQKGEGSLFGGFKRPSWAK